MGFVRRAGRVYALVIALVLAIMALQAPRQVLSALGVFVLAAAVHIVVHELGHALAAWAVRYRVVRIVSGTGPRVLSGHLGETLLELRLVPAGGHVLAASRHPGDVAHARGRELATVTGGPLATLVVILTARWGLPPDLLEVGARVSLTATLERLGWWLLLTNLIPWSPQVDGARMMALLRADDDAIAEAAQVRGIAESMHHLEQGDLGRAIEASADYGDNTAAAAMHAAALSKAGRFGEARAVLLALVAQPLPAERQLVVANNLAWADVHLGGAPLLAEADHWSAIAVELARSLPPPAQAPVASTRAHVLAATGRHAEAEVLFEQALASRLDDHSRAEVLAGRARHRLACGDALGARQLADKAASLAPTSPVVGHAVRLIDNVSLTVVADQVAATPHGWQLPAALAGSAGHATRAGAGRALRVLPSAEPLLTPAAAVVGLAPGQLQRVLAELLGVQDDEANRSSIHAVS